MSTPKVLQLICDAYESMERASTSEQLRAEMESFAKQMGFEKFAYALTVNAPSLKRQQYVLSNFPQPWIEIYVRRGYFQVDPMVHFAERSTLPAIWDEPMFHDAKSALFWEEARAFGLQSGMSFSIHNQPGMTGIFSLARDQQLEQKEDELAALVGRAQMFATILHHAVMRIDLPKLIPERGVALTPRERECLRWTADGKTAWEIGQILNITERTAVFHVNNVTQKLGALNKTQAIARAVVLKLL